MLPLKLSAQTAAELKEAAEKPPVEESFEIYGDHPRLFLNPRRLKLLRRERERTSPRWIQFNTLVAGKAPMTEPGFAWALFYQVSEDEAWAKQAIAWALKADSNDLRQLALVYDWCQSVLSDSAKTQLAAKINRLSVAAGKSPTANSLRTVRDRMLATIALGDTATAPVKPFLQATVEQWWRKNIALQIKKGTFRFSRPDGYAMIELLHAVRDNLQIDLREDAPKYFQQLPAYSILSYYPPSFPAAENEYRIPYYEGDGEPNTDVAAIARAGDLALVAFDTNAQETQFVQGWLIHDRFLMRGMFGITYEFMWANPYQPGLSYYHLPLVMHQSSNGRLALRSSWEEDADWFHYSDGKVQVFEKGRRKDRLMTPGATVRIGEATVYVWKQPIEFTLEADAPPSVFIIGLKPNATYFIEIDDEELTEKQADSGGILSLLLPKLGTRTVLIRS